jgi:hypothetical protein
MLLQIPSQPCPPRVAADFAEFGWVEVDSLGLTSSSQRFARNSSSASDAISLESTPAVYLPQSVASANVRVDPVDPPPNPAPSTYDFALGRAKAHLVVYAVSEEQGLEVYNQVRSDVASTLTVRLICGGNSVQAFRDSLRLVLMANRYEQTIHPNSEGSEWPYSPGPEVYLVGDMEDVIPPTLFDAASFLYACGGEGQCLSDVLLYDVSGPLNTPDGLPDGPFSRIPCSTLEEAKRAALFAHEYDRRINMDPLRRLIVGRDVPGQVGDGVDQILASFERAGLRLGGEIVRGFAETTNAIWPRFAAMARAGVAEIFAIGGFSDAFSVPGSFLDCQPSAIGVRQRVVFWGPGCGVAGLMAPDPFFPTRCGGPAPLLEHYLFGSDSTTTFAGAVGSIGSGYDLAHLEIGQLLADERSKAAAGGGSLARVVYNTIARVAAERPYLLGHALGLGVLGAYVNLDLRNQYSILLGSQFSRRSSSLDSYSIDCYQSAASFRKLIGCPQGDGVGWWLSARMSHPGGVAVDTLRAARLRIADGTDPSIVLWDENGNAVQALAPSAVSASTASLEFDLAKISGCGRLVMDLTVGPSTRLRVLDTPTVSVDYGSGAIGVVDADDLAQVGWTGCTVYGTSSSNVCTPRILNEHVGHMVPRRLLYPRGGETFVWNESVPLSWEPVNGDNATVQFTLWSQNDITYMGTYPAATGHATWAVPWGVLEGAGYSVTCDYGGLGGSGTWIGTHRSGMFAIRAPAGDPSGGCPEVGTFSLGSWRTENTILGGSFTQGSRLDACRLKFVDSRDSVIRLRIYENAEATTQLKSLRLVAVSRGPSEALYADEDSVFVGVKDPPIRVVDAAGVDVSSEFAAGGHGVKLLVGGALTAHWSNTNELSTLANTGSVDFVGGGENGPFIVDDGGGKGLDGLGFSARAASSAVAGVGDPDQAGIVVSAPDSSGGWLDVKHGFPRKEPSGSAFLLGPVDSVRIVARAATWIRYVGRLRPTAVRPVSQKLGLIRAVHNHRANAVADVDSLGNLNTIISPGDTIDIEYRNVRTPDKKVLDYLLLTRGAYSQTLPARAVAAPDTIPIAYALFAARPNPMSGLTSFRYDVPTRTRVLIVLYDLQGRVVRRLGPITREPGRYSVDWEGDNEHGRKVSPGVYMYQMSSGKFIGKGRVVVLP